MTASPWHAGRRRSTPKPPWTGSTSCAPPSRPPARRPRRGHRLQEPQIRRAGLPLDQIRRPGPAPGLPPAGRTRPGPRADLHARLLPHLAPTPAWAPLTFTDENPPAPDNPVAPARRSAAAQAKASARHDPAGRPYRSFRGLLDHLATLTRNRVRFAGASTAVPMLADPTTAQRQAFDLIGAPIPLTLT